MNKKKVFFITFITTFAIMLSAFGVVYFSLDVKPRETDNLQKNVPILKPALDDSKTILACIGDDAKFFFLIKFNAIQNKISVMSISKDYYLPKASRTLNQSFEIAGVFQTNFDLSSEFDITIDYYIESNFNNILAVLKDFEEIGINNISDEIPAVIKNLLLKSAERIDINTIINAISMAGNMVNNDTGIAFLNELTYMLIKNNLHTFKDKTMQNFKNNFNKFNTNITATDLIKMDRIFSFLISNDVTFERDIIISEEEDAQTKVDTLFKE